MPRSTADRVNSDLAGDGPSRLLCFECQLAIVVYQGECASLLVRGNGQLALKAKRVPVGLAPVCQYETRSEDY